MAGAVKLLKQSSNQTFKQFHLCVNVLVFEAKKTHTLAHFRILSGCSREISILNFHLSLSQQSAGDIAAEDDKFVAFGGLPTEDEAAPEGDGATPFDCLA